jgi:hypothetical protein
VVGYGLPDGLAAQQEELRGLVAPHDSEVRFRLELSSRPGGQGLAVELQGTTTIELQEPRPHAA